MTAYKGKTPLELAALARQKDKEAEKALLELARQGIPDAEAALLKYCGAVINNIVSKFFFKDGSADKDDLRQIAKISVFKALKTYDVERGANFLSYASIIIKNDIIVVMRAYKQSINLSQMVSFYQKENEDGDEALSLAEVTASSDDVMSSSIKAEEIENAKAKAKEILSPRQYAVFELMMMGLDYQEIARKLNMDPKAVDNARTALKAKLKKSLKSEDDD